MSIGAPGCRELRTASATHRPAPEPAPSLPRPRLRERFGEPFAPSRLAARAERIRVRAVAVAVYAHARAPAGGFVRGRALVVGADHQDPRRGLLDPQDHVTLLRVL